MSEKERTWPYAVVPQPDSTFAGDWNVRKLNGALLFTGAVPKRQAIDACAALNEAFDWGREA